MPSFSPYTLGLNPYREIVFRSTSQIAGVRTVNRLFAPFSDVRKKKGLRISADPSSRMRKIGFIVVLLRGCLLSGSRYLFYVNTSCLEGKISSCYWDITVIYLPRYTPLYPQPYNLIFCRIPQSCVYLHSHCALSV